MLKIFAPCSACAECTSNSRSEACILSEREFGNHFSTREHERKYSYRLSFNIKHKKWQLLGVFQNFGHCIAELQFGGWRSGDLQYVYRKF
ncbi:MAG: hypothetical protein R2788_22375 [Saprospiraceae bacterium]